MKDAGATMNPLYSPATVLSYVGREDVLSYAKDTSSSASSSNDEKIHAEEDEGKESLKEKEKDNGLTSAQPIDPEVEAQLIAQGQKKVRLHKRLMTAFIFSAKYVKPTATFKLSMLTITIASFSFSPVGNGPNITGSTFHSSACRLP